MHSQRSMKASKPRVAKSATKSLKNIKSQTKKVTKRTITTISAIKSTTPSIKLSTTSYSISTIPPTPQFTMTPPTMTSFTPHNFTTSHSMLTIQHRSKVTFKKVGVIERTVLTAEVIAQDKQQKADAKVEIKKASKTPSLNDLMRRFYKKIHPDLMMAYPEQKEANEKSLAILQNFLSTLKTADGDEKWPTVRNGALSFYLRTPTPGHFQHVQLLLHVDGSMNKKSISRQLCTFFGNIGLSSQFTWDDEFFQQRSRPTITKKDGEDGEEGETAPSDEQRGNEGYDEFMARLKKEGAKQASKEEKM